ncbi:hypothetical protein GALMADRAFT_50088, partial [Galerina marginata CBS 339.88]
LRRKPGQKTAHAIVSFRKANGANHAIEHGLFIEGKRVWARKHTQDPQRCYKCQAADANHTAAQCTAQEDVCGRCGTIADHRTKDCKATNPDNFHCPNCNTRGHGAVDRQCPKFLAAVERARARRPETQLRYYPTADPATW